MRLNIEQKKIIENKPSGQSLVKGVAGSGKTTVAVNRIPFLLKNYCYDNDDRILMVTYNKSLINYIKHIYSEIEQNIEEEQTMFDLSEPNEENKVDLKNIDSYMYAYYKAYLKENNMNDYKIASKEQIQSELIKAINFIGNKYKNIRTINTKNYNFFKDEICWIKSCNYMEVEEYQSIDRLGRSIGNTDGPQKLRKNSELRQAIFEVMLYYNKLLKDQKLIDFQDMALMALEQCRKKPFKRYSHIIVDETQDLTRVQLEFIKELYKEGNHSSMLFVADNAQSIYSQAWLVKGRSFSSINLDMTGKSTILSKNYRTTTQIAQAAYSLIECDDNIVNDDNFVKPSLIDKQGVYPVYKSCLDSKSESEYIISIIKDLIENKKYDFKDIAIISRIKNQLNTTKSLLGDNNIPFKEFNGDDEFDFDIDSVKIMSMYAIKGLEFKVVFIIGLDDRYIPYKNSSNEFEDNEILETRERKLLYVGMTRATEELYMTSNSKPSRFIKDISHRYMRISPKNNFKRIHRINIEDYKFTDKIHDLYGDEEKVRQWAIYELINSYGYPLKLIDVEYEVNIGSKCCLADIVVYIYKNKTKVPYIFIEAKRWGSGTDKALPQLKSYMSNCGSVCYGIATDGNNITIINKEFECIDDIPSFVNNMLPQSIETYEYRDLLHGRSYEFLKDSINDKDIIFDDVSGVNVIGMPVYDNIAAGTPILINSQINDTFYLPDEWIHFADESFILRVKGDSMIEAGIDNGDFVIIKKQPTADNGQIVAADVDGNATLKKLMMMGSNVILAPENSKYEPMMMNCDQVRIIGIATGLVKKKLE